jgi:MFS family permease
VADRAARSRPRVKLQVVGLLCAVSAVVLSVAFGAPRLGLALGMQAQFGLIALGGFFMACISGVVTAVAIEVVHPGIRSTGASVLSLFQNLLGLAAGPFIAGWVSDAWSLETALTVMPAFGLLAAGFFMITSRCYEADLKRVDTGLVDFKMPYAGQGARESTFQHFIRSRADRCECLKVANVADKPVRGGREAADQPVSVGHNDPVYMGMRLDGHVS